MKSLNISRAVIAVMLIVVHVAVVSCLKKVKPKEIPLNLCSVDIRFIDNTTDWPMKVSPDDTIPAKVFGLQLKLGYSEVSNSSFCDTLVPWSEGAYIANQRVNEIVIITHSDFDDNHTAGSDIANYFLVFNGLKYQSFVEYMNEVNENYLPSEVNLLLMELPTNADSFQFTVRITLDDQTILEAVSNSIQISL